MKKIITFGASIALAGGLIAASPSSAEPTTTTVNENRVDTSESVGAGTVRFLDDGVYVRTRDGASEAAGYYTVDLPLADVDTVSQDWSGTAQPGIRLRVDSDSDGDVDGTITYEPVYGGNLWGSSSSTPEFLAGAPHIAPGDGNNDGQGSQWYGTLAEWQAAYPNAVLKRGGFLLGLQGRGTLLSQTFGEATYTFASKPQAKPVAYVLAHKWIRHARVEIHANQPSGTVQTPKGAFYRVQKVNPRSGNIRTVATGRVSDDNSDKVLLRWKYRKHGPKFKAFQVKSAGEVIERKRVRVRF